MTDGINRRRFLKILGVTGGAATVASACGIGPEPTEKLIPYLVGSEDQVPGIATWYASTCRECAAGCGIRVKIREGRAVKIEGNPESPINQGRLCARGQAALQGLYNPDRITEPMARRADGVWEKLGWDAALQRFAAKVQESRGKGIAIVTGLETGAFGDLVDEWSRSVGARHVTYEPFGYEALREGNRLAFGTDAVPAYDFAAAKYILSFGADFLETWVSPVGFQHGFADAHGFQSGKDAAMAKHVFVGPRLSLTAMNADEWIAARPGTEGMLALAMANVIVTQHLVSLPADVGRLSDLLARHTPAAIAALAGVDQELIVRVAIEFAHAGAGLAVAGGMAAHYPNGAEIVAAANILNYVTGAVGKTVKFGPDTAAAGAYRDMVSLRNEMAAGKVALLLVHGANPRHTLSGEFLQAWGKVGYKVSFSSYWDETASAADLILPDLHPLEQWGDSRPRAGVYALQQPVTQPVFSAMATGDVLLKAAGRQGVFKDYLQNKWRDLSKREGHNRPFEAFWNDALQQGGMYGDVAARPTRLGPDVGNATGAPAVPAMSGDVTLLVYPHVALHDGRGANKPWLQELPDPVSKIAWHGWVELHPETAARWQVSDGDILRLDTASGSVRAAAWITPTVRPDVVAVPTGQGHAAYGRYAKDRSFNAFALLPDLPNSYGGRTFVLGAKVSKTGEHQQLATAEGDSRSHGDGIVEVLGLKAAQQLTPGSRPFRGEATPEYADPALEGWAAAQYEQATKGDYAGAQPRWGMAIDLSRCTGCSACVTACYAENNIATVGQDLFTRRREMSWMRIERYFRGGAGQEPVSAVVTPMLCQQCGAAPCEPVCPVFAAYHTPDGLNGQVYNRCVGTRYCANNCPYKVRYFNWYDYAEVGGEHEAFPAPLDMLLNPDVTVREKGVMEKCTFCVQRIRGAQHEARLADRTVQDGDITPACAQSCPSEAIVFGDLNDPRSTVSRLARDPRGYHVLEDLNTKPAITYLARVVHGDG